MTKKLLFLLLNSLLCNITLCSKPTNHLTEEANTFLNSINNNKYAGVNSASLSTFSAHDTLLAESRLDEQPSTPRIFENTIDNGKNLSHAIYRVGRGKNQWQGIYVDQSDDPKKQSLFWTPIAISIDTVDWTFIEKFAERI